MDDYKGKKGERPEELKVNQQQEKGLVSDFVEKESSSLFVDDISKTSQPISDDLSVEEQLAQVEARLDKYYKSKSRQKALDLKSKSLAPLEKKDGNVHVDILQELLSKSTIGETFLAGNKDGKVSLVIDEQIFGVSFHKRLKTIGIHRQMTYGEALYLTAKALRRSWLSLEGDALYALSYLPDDAVLMNRILEADCRVLAIWIAWELKLQSETDMWDFIIQSDDAAMAIAFCEKAKQNFTNLDNGEAAKAAFNTWFSSYSVKPADYEIIQNMLSDEKGYVFSSTQLPLTITVDLIHAIGQVPGGRNYIKAMEEKPLPETEYAVVRDRSNANFLWFVKFEKSFQETELRMLEEERQEKQRKENIEKSQSSDMDIAEVAKRDEKIVDFSTHFKSRLEDQQKPKDIQEALATEEEIPAQVTYLFEE